MRAASSSAIFKEGTTSPVMFQPTLDQVRRAFRIVSGFTLLLAGVIMLVTPGPGWVTIFLGLSLLAAEFVWARRLMNRIRRQGNRIKDVVLRQTDKNSPQEPSATSQEPRESA